MKRSIRIATAAAALALSASALAATADRGGIPGVLSRVAHSFRAAVLCYPLAFSLLDGPQGSGRCRDAGVSPR